MKKSLYPLLLVYCVVNTLIKAALALYNNCHGNHHSYHSYHYGNHSNHHIHSSFLSWLSRLCNVQCFDSSVLLLLFILLLWPVTGWSLSFDLRYTTSGLPALSYLYLLTKEIVELSRVGNDVEEDSTGGVTLLSFFLPCKTSTCSIWTLSDVTLVIWRSDILRSVWLLVSEVWLAHGVASEVWLARGVSSEVWLPHGVASEVRSDWVFSDVWLLLLRSVSSDVWLPLISSWLTSCTMICSWEGSLRMGVRGVGVLGVDWERGGEVADGEE